MDQSDLTGIYTEFQNRLSRFILSRVSDRDAAEDILQDVFLKVHAKIGTLEDGSKLESWIFQIARNAIVDHYRSLKPTEDVTELHAIADETEEQKASERLTPALHGFIQQLPEPYREAVLLTEVQGLSQRELAGRLGLSFSGAKSRVQRGRAMLKDLLLQCCHFEFDRYGTLIDYHERSCCCCNPHDNAPARGNNGCGSCE